MAVTRLDKITGSHLESFEAPEVIKNGYFLQLGELVDEETELRKATKIIDAEAEGEIVLHATPEVDPDPRNAGLKHFTVAKGEAGRGYHVQKGDKITLTVDLFTTLPVVKGFVSPVAGSFLLDTFEPLSDQSAIVFRVLRETTLGFDNDQAFVLQVTKA